MGFVPCRLTGVHDGLVSQLEQQAQLRVHLVGLLRRDAEEGGIERRQVLQLAGPLRQTEHTCRTITLSYTGNQLNYILGNYTEITLGTCIG